MIRGLWGKFFPPDQDPETPKIDATHHHGLINFGNTCYCNSVLQVLDFQVNFFYRFFRHFISASPSENAFWSIANSQRKQMAR